MKQSKFMLNSSISEVCTYYIVIFIVTALLWILFRKLKYKLPPGPNGIKFLGVKPFVELDNLKKIYGNIFSMYIGGTFTVIVSDFEVLKEAYGKTIEKSSGFDIVPDALGFSGQNGEEWTEQRRFVMKAMKDLGVGKEKWESMIQEEVADLVKKVSSFNGQPVDVNNLLVSSVSNTVLWCILGKKLPVDHPDRIFLDTIKGELTQILGKTPSRPVFPTLQDICLALKIGNLYKRLKRFNDFFRKETEKLKSNYKSESHENFITLYLKGMESQKHKPGHFFTETNLLGNIQGMFIWASESTHAFIYWLFLIMATYPDIQDRIHEELDSEVDENGQIRWSERHKIPFTFATIMEGQRWRTLRPLNAPRKATKDMKIQDYDVPKGTTIVGNIWSLHNDPKYWNEPEKFNPSRFLTANQKEVITRQDSYVPFSYGRRNCPGDVIALMEILSYFTAFMQNFTVLPPKGTKPNLNGIQGISYQPFPQQLLFVPRK